jgi:hypothetical protein
MSDEKPKLHIDTDWKAEAQAEKERLSGAADVKPEIQVDADWKAEAQAEKERLEEQEQNRKPREEGRGLPTADFKALMGVLASQAIMGLGAMADPNTGGVIIDLEGARFAIDLLGVLEEKTKGNLEEDEAKELGLIARELRTRFVQVTQALAEQKAGAKPGLSAP